ncbi:MAG: hypothetical protein IPI41_14545 [Flavobacteriales bacterium]|nr:hypothetical protein [Flavobacteriales bacterium]
MRYVLLLLAVALTLNIHAQKVAYEDDLVTVDGQPYCKLAKTNCKLGLCDYHVATLDGAEIIFIKAMDYNDRDKVSSSNPNDRVLYFDWTFLGSGGKAETDQVSAKNLAKAMVDARLLKDGALDTTGERNFIAINGTRHTNRQEQLGLPVIIIQR